MAPPSCIGLILLGAACYVPWEGQGGVVFAHLENAYNFFMNQYFCRITFAKIFYINLPTYLSKNIMQICKYACSMQHAVSYTHLTLPTTPYV